MTIGYYKATNGENCFSLPRRFGYNASKTAYEANDGFNNGTTVFQQPNGTIVESDYQRDRNASSIWASKWFQNRELLKVRQDGTKYTIFVRRGTTFYNNSTTVPVGPSITLSLNGNGSVDPAVDDYVPYREIKTIEIPAGRRSADFIAETFTNSLQNASNLEGYDHWKSEFQPSSATVYENQGVLASVYKTDTYKPFNCANGTNFSSSNFTQIRTYIGVGTNQDILNWVNSFQYIAFKRPEFVEEGRSGWVGQLRDTFNLGNYEHITKVSQDSQLGADTLRVSISIPYTESNCSRLSKWIKTQELYPELWDFRNASNVYHDNIIELTSDNSRFIHLDMVQAFENSSKTLASDRSDFGSDMYTNVGDNASKYAVSSQPLFVTYVKSDENTFYEDPQYNIYSGRENKLLSYGMFLKDSDGNIMVTTEGVGGCPLSYYNASGFFIGGEASVGNASYDLDGYSRHIGYDPHFSAYGNAAIGLWNPAQVEDMAENLTTGFMSVNHSGLVPTLSEIPGVVNQTYLGSSNPKLEYDSVKDRFGFSDFYTPEYLGNDGGAGEDATNNAVVDGSAIVYKINKRIRRQNYAPGMGPYTQKQSITVDTTEKKVDKTALLADLPNRNIYPFSIMDCHSGIAIEKFGISKEVWSNSLMGILGFTYEQLQSDQTSENTIQKRVNTFNIQKLNKVTTQAVIAAQDT